LPGCEQLGCRIFFVKSGFLRELQLFSTDQLKELERGAFKLQCISKTYVLDPIPQASTIGTMPYSKEIFNQLTQPSGRKGKRILSHLNQVNVAINRVTLEHFEVLDGDKILGVE
jgi:hypothetical protein